MSISAVTIGKLIEAWQEKDDKKFLSYAEHIAKLYEQDGEDRAARVIRSRIDGSYVNSPKIQFSEVEYIEPKE